MAMVKYFAGIDAGTTGTTVMIVDEKGTVEGWSYREYPCQYPHAGWVEQDIELVWEKICEASKEVIAKTGIDPSSIVSIGISSQRGTFVCVDKSFHPLHSSIVWNDCRASKQGMSLCNKIGASRYRQITGMPVSALWAASKIRWVVENRKDIIDKTYKIINGQEYLLHSFGAETTYSDPSSLTLNGMLDIALLDWSEEIISAIGLTRDHFPKMGKPAQVEGKVSQSVSAQTGFAPGTFVCRGGGDQQCAAVGAGVIREGLAEITIGTAAMMVAHIDSRKVDPQGYAYIGGHAIPEKWDMEGGAFATGACMKWWRDNYAQIEQEASKIMRIDVYDILTEEASRAPVGCKGLLFFPFFNGQVTPTYNNQARGGLLGMTLAHDRASLIRSVLEGTAFELRMVVEALEAVLGKPFDHLRLTGGGAKSDIWMKIQSDVYGKPIQTLEVTECTTYGAAILGAVAAGEFRSIPEAVNELVKLKKFIEPNHHNNQLYNELYHIFADAYKALRDQGIYERISRLQDTL